MKVILDGVFNHASRGFWPFNHVLECGLDSPYVDWFHVDRELLAAGRPLRAYPDESLRLAIADGDLAEAHAAGAESMLTLGYRAWWDLPALPKLNTDNPRVREYLFGVAEHWIRFGADGWRLDVAAEIDDDEFWREFRRRVKAIDPEAYIVAEIWHEDHRWLQGDQFDAYMNYPLAEAILSFCGGSHLDLRVVGQHGELAANIRPEDGPTFAGRLAHALSTYDPAINAVQLNLLGSHDTPRVAHDVRRRRGLRPPGDARPDDRRRRAVRLLRRRDRHGRRAGSRLPRAAFPADPTAGDTDLRAFVAGPSPCGTAIARCAGASSRSSPPPGRRPPTGAPTTDAHVRRLPQRGRRSRRASASRFRASRAGRLAPETWPGWSWGAGRPGHGRRRPRRGRDPSPGRARPAPGG